MKPNYEKHYNNWRYPANLKCWGWRAPSQSRIVCLDNDWIYSHKYARWYRYVRTFQEERENRFFDQRGNEREFYKIKIRRARCGSMLPDAWDDLPVQRGRCRSWKDGTKHRKQWMVNL